MNFTFAAKFAMQITEIQEKLVKFTMNSTYLYSKIVSTEKDISHKGQTDWIQIG